MVSVLQIGFFQHLEDRQEEEEETYAGLVAVLTNPGVGV
jgi:hypothetical protein